MQFGAGVSKTRDVELEDGALSASINVYQGIELFFIPEFSLSGALGLRVSALPGVDDDKQRTSFERITFGLAITQLFANFYW